MPARDSTLAGGRYGRCVHPVVPTTGPDAEALAPYREASQRVRDKVIHHLDEHCAAFIRLSPFATLATASPDGWPEVSPRGGDPGFVRVLDEQPARPARPAGQQPDRQPAQPRRQPPGGADVLRPGDRRDAPRLRDDDAADPGRAGRGPHRLRQAAAVGAGAAGRARLLPVLEVGHALGPLGPRAAGRAVGLPAVLAGPARPLPRLDRSRTRRSCAPGWRSNSDRLSVACSSFPAWRSTSR